MKTELRWQSVAREALTDVLFGEVRQPVGFGRLSPDTFDLNVGLVAVGFAEDRSRPNYSPPCVVVLDDQHSAEAFSWLRTFADETSPLSQFSRVLLRSDWERYGSDKALFPTGYVREDRWASVALGEALAQGDSVDLKRLPLSRASGCFSTTVALASVVYGQDEATRTCVDRLRQLESDRRFARRSISISDLLPIWAIVGSHSMGEISGHEVGVLVAEAAWGHGGRLMGVPDFEPIRMLRHPGFSSDSVEQRVVTFQSLAKELLRSGGAPRSLGSLSGVMLAAAAFMVGRGTSHHFLLRRYGQTFPSANAWFGLMAALAGPKSWDIDWSRAAKGFEKVIRKRPDWVEPIGADLCWAEFAWLASTYEGGDIFDALPKMFSKALSVEILPGAICQLRLEGEVRASAVDRSFYESSIHNKELQATLAEFVDLAAKAKQFLAIDEPKRQNSLRFEESRPIEKPMRTRRVRPSGYDPKA